MRLRGLVLSPGERPPSAAVTHGFDFAHHKSCGRDDSRTATYGNEGPRAQKLHFVACTRKIFTVHGILYAMPGKSCMGGIRYPPLYELVLELRRFGKTTANRRPTGTPPLSNGSVTPRTSSLRSSGGMQGLCRIQGGPASRFQTKKLNPRELRRKSILGSGHEAYIEESARLFQCSSRGEERG